MRIAYVIPAWPPLPSQPFVVNEMLEVQAAGHELTVVGLYQGAVDGMQHGTYAALRPAHVLPAPLVDPSALLLALWTCLTRPLGVVATLALLRDEARARRMALAARARIVERFTVEAMVRRTTAAYDECLRAAGVPIAAPSPA